MSKPNDEGQAIAQLRKLLMQREAEIAKLKSTLKATQEGSGDPAAGGVAPATADREAFEKEIAALKEELSVKGE